jgi:diguanylate cyclase (GGDEF)-like protein
MTQQLSFSVADDDTSGRGRVEDPLTGLAHRATLDGTLLNAMAAARFAGRPLCVIVVNIDALAAIDDAHGRPVGDAVLCRLAAILRTHCRPLDAAVRAGEDRLVLVLDDTHHDQALEMVTRMRDEVAGVDWSSLANGLGVAPRFGVAADPGHGSAAALLRLAAVSGTA